MFRKKVKQDFLVGVLFGYSFGSVYILADVVDSNQFENTWIKNNTKQKGNENISEKKQRIVQ